MYVGIMGMIRAVWVGQARVWVGHGLPGLIDRTAPDARGANAGWTIPVLRTNHTTPDVLFTSSGLVIVRFRFGIVILNGKV